MMKQYLTLLSLLFFVGTAIAQPVNDDCVGLIDLGIAPICPTGIYTNVDATASDIGMGNIPDCFNGGNVDRDVWFMFTTDNMITDYTITVTGVTDGMGSTPMLNPQIEIYRGDCSFDNLASLEVCASAPDGEGMILTNVFGLDLNTPYFIRVNDYSATATPNSGTFEFCITEYIPDINICDATTTTSCTGTLYDCGGPDGDYGNNENFVFTICPTDFHECITIDMVDFDIEDNTFGFGDALNFYAGDNTGAPLISSVSGTSDGSSFQIFASSPCITIEFLSDGFTVGSGFELTWACNSFPCPGSSEDNPTVIGSVPFTDTGLTSCGEGSTLATSPCPDDEFLWGPDYVFTYDSPGDECISVEVSNADPGTGVLILNGPPSDPGTSCVAVNEAGNIASANLSSAGTYYIIVANAGGCTDFDLNIEFADCNLSPALVDALCNPLNGCQEFDMGGNPLPSTFNLDIGFEDIPITNGLNNGCYLNTGAGNFYWFTIQAQANGPFGFIVDGANFASDIDLSVWGPFTEDEVCETPNDVIDFITNNQPIRSSWSGGADPTGLVDFHPVTGNPVTDAFDCGSPATPGAAGDDFVSTIPAQLDEVYVVLINDWGGDIVDGAIEVDWSPSAPEVLEPLAIEVIGGDTTICIGQSVQLAIETGIADIEWITNTGTLSCTDCPDPVASPMETTIYTAVVDGVCIHDTIGVKVAVYTVEAGPDVTVCQGENIQVVAGSNFDDAVWEWTGPDLSCTDCPDPFITGVTPGTYIYNVTLITPNCTLTDSLELEVLSDPAPVFSVAADSIQLCEGETTDLGNILNDMSNTYVWTSVPAGFSSSDPNPNASPTETTTFYVEVTNGFCPVSSFDSVYVEVFTIPDLAVAEDTLVCEGEVVSLGNTIPESGVVYSWSPDTGLDFDSIPNPLATIDATTTYTLTAINGACTITDEITVTSTVISVDIDDPDSLLICRGEEVNLTADAAPFGTTVTWTPDNGTVNPGTGLNVIATPQTATTYYASVNVPGCTQFDSIYIDVDSLPADLQIMPSDTSVCAGSIVVLKSPTYEQSDFPDIDFQWEPAVGFQSPDSLLNMVIEAVDTIWYTRTSTNGICTQVDSAFVSITEVSDIFINPVDTVICSGESITLSASSPDVTEFTWSSDQDNSFSCTECPSTTVSPGSTATYTVEGEFMDCPVNTSTTVTVVSSPTNGLINSTNICEGESILLNLSPGAPDDVYTWTASPADPTLITDIAQPNVTPLQTTTYAVTISNGVCPPIEEEIEIEVIQVPTLSVSEDITICANESTTLVATSSIPGIGTFTWNTLETGAEITVDPDLNAQYIVTYDFGCDFNLMDTVNVEVLPAPGLDLIDDDVICIGNSVALNLESGNPEDIFVWTAEPADPTLDPDTDQPVVTPTQTTTYFVTADNGVCDEQGQVEIIVQGNPVVTVPADQLLCLGDEITLTATSSEDGGTFEWSNGDSGESITVSPDSTQTFVLTYTNMCEDTIISSVVVEVVESPEVSIVSDPLVTDSTFYQGDVITLTAVLLNPIAGVTYTWNTGQTGPTINVNANFVPQETFSVIVTTPDGCEDEASINAMVAVPLFEMPNTFTPNNDNINDFFNVVSAGNITVDDFRIYNRWGELVYDNDTPATGWDGTYKGKNAPADMYIYYITVTIPNGTTTPLQGDLTLIR